MGEQQYWLGFSLIPKIGPKRLLRLRKHFGTLSKAWAASSSLLSEAGLTGQALESLLQYRQTLNLAVEMEKLRKANIHLLTLDDNTYPSLLKQLDDAPAVLYVKGQLTEADHLALSIVGTRKVTRYGRDVTFELAQQLAQQGITIISGLANGVDSAAHQGAIKAGGRTIAVLGCGADIVYPHNNRDLAEQVIANGAIISEFPIGTKPIAANFPRRNRIISGLALGVLITEAPEHSGALITADCAADQGREVFAVPANIFNKMGRGANRLIQDGAKLVMEAQDILDELNIAHDVAQTRVIAERINPANEAERRLLQHLDIEPIHIDELTRISGLSIAEVTSTLTILELKGVAQMVGQMQYSRVLKSK